MLLAGCFSGIQGQYWSSTSNCPDLTLKRLLLSPCDIYQGNYLYGYKWSCLWLCYLWKRLSEMHILFLTSQRRKMLGHSLVTYCIGLTCSVDWRAHLTAWLAKMWPTHVLTPTKSLTWCSTKFFSHCPMAVVKLTGVGDSILQKPQWVTVIWISLDNWIPQPFQINVILYVAGRLEFTKTLSFQEIWFYVRATRKAEFINLSALFTP